MARKKAKVYSRFNVGVFLKEKRRLRDEAAKTHKVLVKQKAKLSNLIRKVSIHTPTPRNKLLTYIHFRGEIHQHVISKLAPRSVLL